MDGSVDEPCKEQSIAVLFDPPNPLPGLLSCLHECSYLLLPLVVAAADMEVYGTSMGVAKHSINVNRTLLHEKAGK